MLPAVEVERAILLAAALVCGCARASDGRNDGRGDGGVDLGASSTSDLAGSGGTIDLANGGGTIDLATGGGMIDLANGGGTIDLATGGGAPDLATGGGGIINGGSCASGASGATGIRVRWVDAGGTAQVQYEAFGMPDHSRQKVSAYGYQIGFVPPFVDPYLGAGGLQLDGSDFVDIELSGSGIASVSSATLAIYGRSYDTTTSGSFNWQSFSDSGQTATDFVSNVAPYRWYAADIGNTVAAGDANILVRIKAGPSSGALVVNRIEICLSAH
jgi:hypothetical protein